MSSRTAKLPAAETLRRVARWTATPAGLAALFAAGLLVRLVLGRGGGFPGDIRIFQDWARVLGETGPGDFYSTASFADYPPGYLYVLWPLGELAELLFDGTLPVFLVKLPAMLADLGLAWAVMRLAVLVAGTSGNERWWVRPAAAAAILFNPPIVFLSAVWGQVDSVAAFYALAGILLLAPRDASVPAEAGGAALLALAFATKPQTAFLLPVIALVLVLRHVRGREPSAADLAARIGTPLLSFVLVWCALGVPFGLTPAGLLDFYATAGSTYPLTSVWAFNLWGVAAFWRPDSGADAFRVFGLDAVAVGVTAFSAAACYVLIRVFVAVRERRPQIEVVLGGGAAIVCLSFALLTRIHERYLFLALACLAPLIVYPRVRAAFGALALLYMVNLYFPWVYYNEIEGVSTLKIGWLFDLLYGTEVDATPKKLLSLATGAFCVLFAWRVWDMAKVAPRRETAAPDAAPPAAGTGSWRLGLHPIGRRGAALAGIIFLVVLPTRLAGLSSPQEMYFDEIYHARTAGEYLEGKDAYEYTHPPLGKELMALSTAAFSGWGAADAGDAPALLDSGVADSNGTIAVWAAPAPAGDVGVLWAASVGKACSFDGVTPGAELSFVPHAVAVDPSVTAPVAGPPIAGAYVAGSAGEGSVVVRWYGDAEHWRERVRSTGQIVDIAGAGDVVFAVDEAGTLWHVQPGSATELRGGAAAVAYDPDSGGVWVAIPGERLVVAYDAGGTELARPSTYGNPDEVVVVHDADRVLAFDSASGLIEGIDNQSKAWVGQLETEAGTVAPGPGKGLAYAVSGRDVDVVEPRGLTVIGEATLPAAPDALVSIRSDGALAAVTGEDVACVSGDNAFAWRLPGALSGALIPALVFLLALRCTGSVFVAALAAVLMALDGLGFAMSRIATLDSQATAHIVASWLAALSAFFHARRARAGARGARRLGVVWLAATCVFLGLAIATKWVGVYSFLAIALVIVVDLVARRERGIGALVPGLRGPAVAAVAAAVVLVPLGIYVLSYVPYLSLDHSFGDLARLQKSMYDYHSKLQEGHPYSSPWYGWPVGYKAVALWAGTSGTETGAISAIANPVVLLGGLWALAVAGVAAWRQRIVAPLALVGAALVQYLPWVLVSRAAFLYHYLPVVPFLAVALAWVLGREQPSRRRTYETAVVVAAAAAVFAVTLPELDGWYTSPGFHESLHGWFPWMF
jgi:predicted membrane-bound dolichyl-phosphate-mannose-protein mannosyltransferase